MSTPIINQQTPQNLMQLANNMNIINSKVDELASALGGLTIGGEVWQAIDGRGHMHYRRRRPAQRARRLLSRRRLRDGPGIPLLVQVFVQGTRPRKFYSAATMLGTPRDGDQEYVKHHYLSSVVYHLFCNTTRSGRIPECSAVRRI